eukprot:gnl/Dysnectes_brevis/6540_a10230_315.p1 GENE.gnl/Dysnectes_brevis/6540_a10230_315~~gnl/Dysnectes_brevis/6540_a10230_315.p1  ORF type:complete len:741 (+),score=200.78 gnl/Dysnectes_brevis/6540_a10230_315:29-2224(+)
MFGPMLRKMDAQMKRQSARKAPVARKPTYKKPKSAPKKVEPKKSAPKPDPDSAIKSYSTTYDYFHGEFHTFNRLKSFEPHDVECPFIETHVKTMTLPKTKQRFQIFKFRNRMGFTIDFKILNLGSTLLITGAEKGKADSMTFTLKKKETGFMVAETNDRPELSISFNCLPHSPAITEQVGGLSRFPMPVNDLFLFSSRLITYIRSKGKEPSRETHGTDGRIFKHEDGFLIFWIKNTGTKPIGVSYDFKITDGSFYPIVAGPSCSVKQVEHGLMMRILLKPGEEGVAGLNGRGHFKLDRDIHTRCNAGFAVRSVIDTVPLKFVPDGVHVNWSEIYQCKSTTFSHNSTVRDKQFCQPRKVYIQDLVSSACGLCSRYGVRFYDQAFPPVIESIIPPNHPNASCASLRKTITKHGMKWKRISDIPGGCVFAKRGDDDLGADAYDIKQGCLGDCWFLSVMASCADADDKLIVNLFNTTRLEDGMVSVKVKYAGKWWYVIVDDYIPFLTSNGRPLFASSTNPLEFWPSLMEKALAKICGGYMNIEGGNTMRLYSCINPEKAISAITGARMTYHRLTPAVFLKLVQQYKLESDTNLAYFSSKGANETVDSSGIVAGHAYSLLDVEKVSGEVARGDCPSGMLVKLRNPWSRTEATAKIPWSDSSPLWDKYPALAKRLNFVKRDDGEFWLDVHTLCKFYRGISIFGPRNTFHVYTRFDQRRPPPSIPSTARRRRLTKGLF